MSFSPNDNLNKTGSKLKPVSLKDTVDPQLELLAFHMLGITPECKEIYINYF